MSKKYTTSDFIRKSNIIHNNVYDYSKSQYVNDRTNLVIICGRHGEFNQVPNVHYRSGCPECGLLRRSNYRRNNVKELLDKFINKHGSKYDYSKMEYVKMKDKIMIHCNIHDIDFLQSPIKHLDSKTGGCPKCNSIGKGCLDKESFIEKSISVHGDRYDYSESIYVKSKKKVKILCKEHGLFEITPNSHLNGRGCPKCNRNGGIIENQWLDELNIPIHNRQSKIDNYYVDGIDLDNKIMTT